MYIFFNNERDNKVLFMQDEAYQIKKKKADPCDLQQVCGRKSGNNCFLKTINLRH
jgi:hypothetical protein